MFFDMQQLHMFNVIDDIYKVRLHYTVLWDRKVKIIALQSKKGNQWLNLDTKLDGCHNLSL